ncbi:hypothetical protein [Nocardioides pakistanensis]
MSATPSIFVMYQDAPEHAPEGPGWYLSVPDPAKDNQEWAITPVKVDVAAVLAAADVLDAQSGSGVRGFVAAQSAKIAEDLAAKVAQKQALLAEIEEAERVLAALSASGVQAGAHTLSGEGFDENAA